MKDVGNVGVSNFIAIDLGASGGRVLLGRWDGSRFELQELHRFVNEPVRVMGRLHWDVLKLWAEIKTGLRGYAARFGAPLAGIGVDTWGVDFALLDGNGRLLGNPHHYRDGRTNGVPERLFARLPRQRLYHQTGIQSMQINTLYQLYSMVEAGDPQLEPAHTLLMMPDLFHYWLCHRQASEYTIASTSQMLHARERSWAVDLLSDLGLPTAILPPVVAPGTVLGELQPELGRELGLQSVPVIAPGAHDTASAVAAVPELDASSAYISSGTWSLMGIETFEPVLSEEALALNVTNEGGVGGTIRLLKNVAGLWLLQECQRQWRREGSEYGWDELVAAAARAAPFRSLIDPDAPVFLNPGDMPAAVRTYCRRTGQPEPGTVGALVRCCLESLALKYRWVLDALEGLTGRSVTTIRVVGGGSKNEMLCQFTANACERPVVAGPVEATALGNLMIQTIARGLLPDVAAGRRAVADSVSRQRFEPQGGGEWQQALVSFRALVEA